MFEQVFDLFYVPGYCVEIRAKLKEAGKSNAWAGWATRTVSGYFTDRNAFVDASEKLEASGKCEAIWVTLNPVRLDLLARGNNRMVDGKVATSDTDIDHRRWLLIDFDPVRPAGISATRAELQWAARRAKECREILAKHGWPQPVSAVSGNGAHLLYRIDVDDAVLIEHVLKALDLQFADDSVDLDTTTYNASRVTKLYGTTARKGDHTEPRPHRTSSLLSIPDDAQPVPSELLHDMATIWESHEAEQRPARPRLDLPGDTKWTTHALLEEYVRNYGQNGTRNEGGFALAVQLRDQGYAQSEAEHTLCEYAAHFDDSYTEAEALASVRQAYKRNSREPRAEPRAQQPPALPKQGVDRTEKHVTYHRTDLGNALRMVALHGHELRHVALWNKWLIWDGRRWAVDETNEIERRAKSTVASIYQEAADVPGNDDVADRLRQALAKWAMQSEAGVRLREMMTLARSEAGVAMHHNELDNDRMLFTVRNGTLDLRTGQLRPHRQKDHITKLVDVDYDPGAQCPTWHRFLDDVTHGDAELQAYLQRAVGYSLTGQVSEQCLMFLYGTGANGKSTFMETITALLGDYSQRAPTEMIMTKPAGAVPNDIARLVGARFVVASEVDNRHLNESVVKDLTGGDTITARFMRGEYFEFAPTHTLWIFGNHKPRIRGTDHGIWRRIHLIPFTVQIPKPQRDPHLGRELLAELPGILAWAVAGCRMWLNGGLQPPAVVMDATDEYRHEMDALAPFIEECCVVNAGAFVVYKELYAAYHQWCEESGEKAMGKRNFSNALTERGYEGYNGTDNIAMRRGLGLRSDMQNIGL